MCTSNTENGKMWPSITSMVLGLLTTITILGNEEEALDSDTLNGCILFAVLAIVFAGVAMKGKYAGNGMAITGLVTGIIGLLLAFGLLL